VTHKLSSAPGGGRGADGVDAMAGSGNLMMMMMMSDSQADDPCIITGTALGLQVNCSRNNTQSYSSVEPKAWRDR
jgi:hypothetical protein